MKNNIVNISIISHNDSHVVKNILEELCNFNFFDKILLTINIKENIDELKNFKNLPIEFIINKKPKGFGENHNYAHDLSNCDYFIIINPDVKLQYLNFEVLISYFNSKKADLLTPTAVDEYNIIQDNARVYPSIFTPFLRRLGFFKSNSYDNYNDFVQVDWISGMFMMIKSDTFKNINGFDEKFYMYYEDIDLCRRIRVNGGKILRINTEKIYHVGQHQSHKSLKYLVIHLKSMVYYHCKYFFKKKPTY